nr:PREDICTED: uncharacterized protein LOC109035855 [Bemisia tabaci]
MAVIEVEPFVLMVRENDLLYNKNRTDYKDHEKKMECWQNIARVYGVPVTVVLAKWKSLREKYIKERKQVRLHGPGALKWEHHNLFKFLDPYIFPRNRQKRCVRARPMEVSVPPSAILDDSSSQGLYIDEGDHDPRSGEVSGNSSTVEDSGLHYSISTSIHPASTSVLPASSSRSLGDHTNEPREFVASTSRDPVGQRRHPPYSEEVYPSNQVSDFVSMLQAKVERIRNTCEMLNEDELFSCEVIEELKRKRSQKVKREIKMKILGIFNDYDGIGED